MDVSEKTVVPEHWIETALGNILYLKNGYAFKSTDYKSEGIPIIRISDIQDGIVILENTVKIPKELFKDDFVVRKGDLLIAMSGATTGKFGTYNEDEIILQNQRVGNLKLYSEKYVIPTFRNYLIASLKETIEKAAYGGAQPNISPEKIESLQILLPPLAEQQRIVEKLDAILPRVKAAKARLEKIPTILKRFRQGILAAACSGRLTKDWREEKKLDDWQYDEAENLCHLITKGTTPKANELLTMGDIPFLKVYNIVGQKINFNYRPQWITISIHNNSLKRSKVYPNDVLMNIVGPPLGKVAIVTNQYKEWNVNQALAIFRSKGKLIPELIYMTLCEGSPISEIENEFRGTAGQSNISLEQCRKFKFPIPAKEEQQEVVLRVEKLFTLADSLEAKYKLAMQRIERIEQAVLAKAFRGELAAQDPNDEPADVLLQRILAEKEKQVGLKANKNGKTKNYKVQDQPGKIAAEESATYKKRRK